MEIPRNDLPPMDLTLYESILNSPLFDIPPEIGTPGQKFKGYPKKDGMGTYEMRDAEPVNEKEDAGYAPIAENEDHDPHEEPLSMPDSFIYHRGLPDMENQTMLDDPSGPVKQSVPKTFHSPSIAAADGVKFVIGRPKGKDSTEVQTVIFKKGKFNEKDARAWLKKHGFKSTGVDETEDSYRFRQKDPGEFEKDSFRTITPGQKKEASMKQTDIESAATQMAKELVEQVAKRLFKSVEEAYIRLYPYIKGHSQCPDTFTQMAVNWAMGLVSALSTDEQNILESKAREVYEKSNRKEVSDKMATEKADKTKGYPLGNVDKGPNQEEGIPTQMPGGRAKEDEYRAPGDSKTDHSPDTKNPSEKKNDELTFPKDGKIEDFHSKPEHKDGVPNPASPTYKQTDKDTFPREAHDLNLRVTPGNQSPETERHQPYFKKQGPNAPWERKSQVKKADRSAEEFPVDPTPGMEFLYKSEDEHISSLDANAQEAELFYKRYLKHGQQADLDQQANRFRAERITMGLVAHCGVCDEDNKTYANSLFAYSYSQMRHSLSRAMKQFHSKDADPNMEQYHAMTALKADLMGSETQQYLHNAAAKAEILCASYTADHNDSCDCEDCEDASRNENAGIGLVKSKDKDEKKEKDEKDGGEKDMKAAEVKEAIQIAKGLLSAKLIKSEDFADKVTELAGLPAEQRATWAKLVSNVEPSEEASEQSNSNSSKEQLDASVLVARKNMVGSGVQDKAGDNAQKAAKQANIGRMIGIFSKANSPAGLY